MEEEPIWVIRNRHDPELFWDGEMNGWFLLSLSTQSFFDDDKAQHELPPDGEWVQDN